jgi:hypothetical protein
VTYANTDPWPVLAKGAGRSLELIDPNGDQSDPANWQASAAGGSPGQVNSVPTVPIVRINEVMAANIAAVSNAWGFSDWVELYNSGGEPVDLAGWILSRDGGRQSLIFPDKTTLAAGGYLVVWCDGLTGFPGLHAGFSLERQGGTLALYDRTSNRVDVLSYGPQLPDYSLGRGTSAAKAWQLNQPTPGADNQPLAIPLATNLILNEWMANPEPGSADWVELFNPSDVAPAVLTGVFLETSHALFQIKSPAFVAPRGYVRLWADEKPGGNHLDFKLPSVGGQINLYDGTGRLLDHIIYGTQAEGASEGRLPDGAATIVEFPNTPTPGSSNTLTVPLVLSVRSDSRTAGGFQFQISGQAGAEYHIIFSTDLVHWTPLGTVGPAGKLVEYTDALTTNSLTRFYRALVQPNP